MAHSSPLILDSDGYFSTAGQRFVPVGVNYWPGSTGAEMWQRWPEAEIQRDLDLVRTLGLNSVRFFLRWQDFEPDAGCYDRRMFARLAQFLTWCRERDLYAQPSLFVGWMSGGTFWPRWRAGRNVFADPFMLERATAFAREAAAALAPFHEGLLPVDQGNELCCLADCHDASPRSVVHWCRTISNAIRSAYPQCLIISGNEQNQITGDTGWRFGQQPGTDLYSMHGYPVPGWHSVGFDGMTDPLCQSLLPFYTRVARAFGPVMVQEFGTIVTFGPRQQDSYLRAILPACWEAGANGFLWWCLRDITAPVQPYLKNAFEGTLGLVDSEDRIKPGLEYYIEFAHSLAERPTPAHSGPEVGLYWPKHYYPRENPANPGNEPYELSRRLIVANYLLQRLGYQVRIVRGDLPLDSGVRTLIIPGALLGADEAEALAAWVQGGGRAIWHGPDPVNWGPAYIRLLGARPVDYRAAHLAQVRAGSEVWTLESYPRHIWVEVAPETATVIADASGLPILLANRLGQGTVTYALPFVEDAVAAVAAQPGARDRWQAWYAALLG